MSNRLFDIEGIPEVPLFRPPKPRKGARGGWQDERLSHDYPPEWDRCSTCGGSGWDSPHVPPGEVFDQRQMVAVGEALDGTTGARWLMPTVTGCPDCLGMGSLKARVRLEAGHRCVRCKHPYMPKVDAAMLGVEPSGMHECEPCGGKGLVEKAVAWSRFVGADAVMHAESVTCGACKGAGKVWTPWSACDELCAHGGPFRGSKDGREFEGRSGGPPLADYLDEGWRVEAEWRILTVHHLDGDKANVRWWNLAALCQRCHLEIQAKVVMERVYPHEHSEWFRPYAAGYYAFVYLGEDLSRAETEQRLDELLNLERAEVA